MIASGEPGNAHNENQASNQGHPVSSPIKVIITNRLEVLIRGAIPNAVAKLADGQSATPEEVQRAIQEACDALKAEAAALNIDQDALREKLDGADERAEKQLAEANKQYEERRKAEEERINQHLANGGRVTNPNALTEEQLQLQRDGQAKRFRSARRENKTLLGRAKAIKDEITWADKKPVGCSASEAALKLARCERVDYAPNETEMNAFRLYDALFVGGEIDEVHYDTAAHVVRDEEGEEINDRYPVRQLADAARATGLKMDSPALLSALKAWSRSYKMNDIREHFLAKLATIEWDGKSRQESFLIDLLKGSDTPFNRTITRYWLASLYMRATHPGCYCPSTLVLIGGQYSGKSQFWRLVNQAVMCKPDVATAPFDPSAKDKTRFLRNVSGRSFIGHMGEMRNFGTINNEDWKDFSTASEDTFDQKYRDPGPVQRQWIFGGDSNEYVGFWRDNNDTDALGVSQGERRLIPFFVHQNADSGDIRWSSDESSRVDYTGFEYEFYQAMKEAQKLMDEGGMEGYLALVDENTRAVREFSAKEKADDQGTVRVKDFDESFMHVLARAARSVGKVKIGEEIVWGLKYFNADIKRAYQQFMPGGKNITPQGITKSMVKFGAVAGRDPNVNSTCYLFSLEAIYGAEVAAKMKKAGSDSPNKLVANSEKLFAGFDERVLGRNELAGVTQQERDEPEF